MLTRRTPLRGVSVSEGSRMPRSAQGVEDSETYARVTPGKVLCDQLGGTVDVVVPCGLSGGCSPSALGPSGGVLRLWQSAERPIHP